MTNVSTLIKKFILGSPLEGFARRLYIRLDQSPWSHYDRLTLAIMKRCLRPDSNCVDIGAHRGTILAEIVHLAPAGTHYAFEPVPQHAHYLAKTFPTVKVHTLALSDTKQQTTFAHDLQHPTRSSFTRPPSDNQQIEIISVQTDLLDNLLPPSLPIHFIKLDVEGAEFQVLRGSLTTIKTHQPVIVFEHSPLAQHYYGATSEVIYDLLTQECHLSISLMPDWLQHQSPLSCAAFSAQVTQARNFYFVAHP